MRKPQGMTINYSTIYNEDGTQEIGFRYNDTDGINIDKHYEGIESKDIYSRLLTDIMKDISIQSDRIKQEKERKALEAKKAEEAKKAAAATKNTKTQSYEEIIEDLRKRIQIIESENKSLKLNNEALNRKIKENTKTQETLKQIEEKTLEEAYDWFLKLFDNSEF